MPDDHAGVTTQDRPQTTQGFSSAGLADFNRHFEGLVAEQKLAGVVTLIARHGEIVNLEARGRLDVSKPDALQVDSIFRIASMTKPNTGAAMMMLWEEGKWALDDRLEDHIPEFKGLKVRTRTVIRSPRHRR